MRVRILCLFFLLIPVCFLVSGCEQQTQYSILTTIFTGVPPMEELYGEAAPEKTVAETFSLAQSDEYMYQHPLWADGQCASCHILSEHTAVQAVKQSKNNSLAPAADYKAGGPTVAGLLLPADKLCIKCHLDKTARRAIRDRLWLHNPVAQGKCLACHAEHQSPHQAHLRLSPAELCLSCHKVEQLPEACADGPGTRKCLGCHNTHMGKNRKLLASEYTEVKIMAGTVPVPPVSQPLPPPQSE